MFNKMTIEEFTEYFNCEDKCRNYLFQKKWGNGFSCSRCGHKLYYKGRTRFHARCRKCDYDESVTANTIFHKIKIPLKKAFGMLFCIAVRVKGMSTVELAREYKVRQSSSWLLTRKAQEAMRNGVLKKLKSTPGIKNLKIKGLIISHRGGKIDSYFNRNCILDEQFFNTAIQERDFGLGSQELKEKVILRRQDESFEKVCGDIRSWNFTNSLLGVHHHCSIRFLSGYVASFVFRYMYRKKKNRALNGLIDCFVQSRPYCYKANGV